MRSSYNDNFPVILVLSSNKFEDTEVTDNELKNFFDFNI